MAPPTRQYPFSDGSKTACYPWKSFVCLRQKSTTEARRHGENRKDIDSVFFSRLWSLNLFHSWTEFSAQPRAATVHVDLIIDSRPFAPIGVHLRLTFLCSVSP